MMLSNSRSRLWASMVLLILGGSAQALAESLAPFEERLLSTATADGPIAESPVFARRGNAVAYCQELPDQTRIVHFGNSRSEPLAIASHLVLSDSPKPRLAYIESAAGEAPGERLFRVVCDGVPSPLLLMVLDGPLFDPVGEHLYYAAISRDHRRRLFVDGIPRIDQERQRIAFAGGGNDLAYAEQSRNRWHVVFGNYIGGDCDDISEIAISPDGQRVAYVGRIGDNSFVMCDGVRGKDCAAIWDLQWNASGKYCIYCAEAVNSQSGQVEWMIVRGQEVIKEDSFVCKLRSSADDSRMLYWKSVSQLPKRWRLVSEGRSLGESDSPGECSFSPDGTGVAWVEEIGKAKRVLHVDDWLSVEMAYVGSIVWDSEGKKVAFGALCGREFWWKVVPVMNKK